MWMTTVDHHANWLISTRLNFFPFSCRAASTGNIKCIYVPLEWTLRMMGGWRLNGQTYLIQIPVCGQPQPVKWERERERDKTDIIPSGTEEHNLINNKHSSRCLGRIQMPPYYAQLSGQLLFLVAVYECGRQTKAKLDYKFINIIFQSRTASWPARSNGEGRLCDS